MLWKGEENEARAGEFAKIALEYAKNKNNSEVNAASNTATSTSVVFNDLPLGYYLVDSTVGSLCGLTTTKPTVTIEEKNGAPTVTKRILPDFTTPESKVEVNDASIGDVVTFETDIHVKKGASKYTLYDNYGEGFTLVKTNTAMHEYDILILSSGEGAPTIEPKHYTYTNDTENHTFTISFDEEFLKNNSTKEYHITVQYSAKLNINAKMNMDNDYHGNTNTTYLTYGDNNTRSVTSSTETYTHLMPVFKFTKDPTSANEEKGLEGAKFKLYHTGLGSCISFKKISDNEYRVTDGILDTYTVTDELISPNNGKFVIYGLGAGSYELEETEAPKGYNKLMKRIKVKITEYGTIIVNDDNSAPQTVVKVENKSGTLLPSTGGAGTTMLYVVGFILVLGSGIVLATKKRANSK